MSNPYESYHSSLRGMPRPSWDLPSLPPSPFDLDTIKRMEQRKLEIQKEKQKVIVIKFDEFVTVKQNY